MRAATEANLGAAGYEWIAVLLKPDALNTASAVDFKALERKKLGYVVVVNMGTR